MVKRKKQHLKKNNSLRKKRNQQQEEVRNVNNILVEKNLSLSNHSYRLYCLTLSNEKIGYFGVYQNGYFSYAVIDDTIDSNQVLEFIKTYIRKGLNLTPIEKARLHPIPMHLVAE